MKYITVKLTEDQWRFIEELLMAAWSTEDYKASKLQPFIGRLQTKWFQAYKQS